MVTCSFCGRPIDKIPAWMERISVTYLCNNCPNRSIKNIASVSLEIDKANALKLQIAEEDPDIDLNEDIDADKVEEI